MKIESAREVIKRAIDGVLVHVAADSIDYLKGSQVDYSFRSDSGFKIINLMPTLVDAASFEKRKEKRVVMIRRGIAPPNKRLLLSPPTACQRRKKKSLLTRLVERQTPTLLVGATQCLCPLSGGDELVVFRAYFQLP